MTMIQWLVQEAHSQGLMSTRSLVQVASLVESLAAEN